MHIEIFNFIDIDDCDNTKEYSPDHEPCFSGVDCRDRKAPRRGFDCGPCPKGFVGNGKICQKEGDQKLKNISENKDYFYSLSNNSTKLTNKSLYSATSCPLF